MYYGNTGAAPMSSVIGLLDTLGNDFFDSQQQGDDKTFNTHHYEAPDSIKTVRWRIYHSKPASGLYLKGTTNADEVVDSQGPFGLPGTNTFTTIPARVSIPKFGYPGFYSADTLFIWNSISCPTCNGATIAGNATSGTLTGSYTNFIPCMKIWYREDPGIEPMVNFGEEIDRSLPVLITPAMDQSVCQGDTVPLGTDTVYFGYQWTRNGSDIAGATGTTYPAVFTGAYNVRVDLSSCDDKLSPTRNVSALPDPSVVSISPDGVCNGEAFNFSFVDTSGQPLVNFDWDFGDGASGTGPNPSHTYATIGTYTVTLRVESSIGCRDTFTQSVGMFPNPVASFTTSNVCRFDTSVFINGSTIDPLLGSTLTDTLWDFGNGFGAVVSDPMYIYPAAGTYDVSCIVLSDIGCSDTATQTVIINPTPIANFNYTTPCPPGRAVFNNLSSPPFSTILYEFGEGSVASVANPVHNYALPGTYDVSLTVTSDSGCATTNTQSILIDPPVIADFDGGDVCDGDQAVFEDISSGGVVSWDWNLGDGSIASDSVVTHNYGFTGPKTITLIVANNDGCRDTLVRTINVNPLPNVNLGGDTSFCFGGSTTIDAGAGFAAYFWSTGSSSQTITTASTGIYAVTVVDFNVCQASDSITVTVFPLPVVNLGPDQVICYGQNTVLDAGAGFAAYLWPELGLDDQAITVSEEGNYSVMVVDTAGCDSDFDTIFVDVDTTADQDIIVNTGADLIATTGTEFQWYLDGVAIPGATQMNFSPSTSGNYSVQIRDAAGCLVMALPFEVDLEISLEDIPEGYSPNGDGVNDEFIIPSVQYYTNSLFTVYNRWGNKVYEETGYSNSWNGQTTNGAQLPEGTYFYVLDLGTGGDPINSYVVIFR